MQSQHKKAAVKPVPEMMDAVRIWSQLSPSWEQSANSPWTPGKWEQSRGTALPKGLELAHAPLEQLVMALKRDKQVATTVALGSR